MLEGENGPFPMERWFRLENRHWVLNHGQVPRGKVIPQVENSSSRVFIRGMKSIPSPVTMVECEIMIILFVAWGSINLRSTPEITLFQGT